VAKMEEQGLIYRNQSSAWESAPHIVSKPKAGSFRFTLDYKSANEAQIPSKWPMPHLESELAKVVGSTCFATFDFSNGYFQLPLYPDSQEFQSFICPDGIFSPTRVMQGNANAGGHFQSVFDNLLVRTSLDSKCLRWLDNVLAHSDSESAHLVPLHDFFSLYAKHGLKIHARKCVLFTKTARWCGRLISGNSVKF
jgi:Reverse transcriptase (RNA-dependent DNA polymerase)